MRNGFGTVRSNAHERGLLPLSFFQLSLVCEKFQLPLT
jgi:hypothetical protein